MSCLTHVVIVSYQDYKVQLICGFATGGGTYETFVFVTAFSEGGTSRFPLNFTIQFGDV